MTFGEGLAMEAAMTFPLVSDTESEVPSMELSLNGGMIFIVALGVPGAEPKAFFDADQLGAQVGRNKPPNLAELVNQLGALHQELSKLL